MPSEESVQQLEQEIEHLKRRLEHAEHLLQQRTTLPYLLQAHRRPEDLLELDDDLDASTLCTVARRASLAQGLALLNVWERSFRPSFSASITAAETNCASQVGVLQGSESSESAGQKKDSKGFRRLRAHDSLAAFSSTLKNANHLPQQEGNRANGHLAPLWGVFSMAMGIDIDRSAYIFMFNHAKAVSSAAVRASVLGPYQAQAILASKNLQTLITERMTENWNTAPEDAGQVTPIIDLWVGRHELLYSRIFNS
ncbi:hypothetical protein KEM54_000107 [Ascosphaera aggregata]|nr:hypothetical protein KEM54_000107 [Ascosphaera aggregata]